MTQDKMMRFGVVALVAIAAVTAIIVATTKHEARECVAAAAPSGCAKGLFCSESTSLCLSREQCSLQGEVLYSNDACFKQSVQDIPSGQQTVGTGGY